MHFNERVSVLTSREKPEELVLRISYDEPQLTFLLLSLYKRKQTISREFSCNIDKDVLEDERNGIHYTLSKLAFFYENNKRGKFDVSIQGYHKQLAMQGHSLYKKLIQTSNSKHVSNSAVALFNEIFSSISDSYPIRILIVCENFVVPVEFINRTGSFEMKDFIGPNFIISKSYNDGVDYLGNGKPKLACILYSGGLGALKRYYEKNLFEVLKKEQTEFEVITLNDGRNTNLTKIKEGLAKDTEINIVHLEGHIRHMKHSMHFSHFDFKNLKISFSEIGQLDELRNKVLFLNNCQSGVNSNFLPDNFTKEFHNKNVASIISSDFDIPRLFARNFATLFYLNVLQRKFPLDKALYITKEYFRQEENSILGWIYSVYGEVYVN